MTAISATDVALTLRRPLTEPETQLAEELLIPAMQEIVEDYLNRVFGVRTFNEVLTPLPLHGTVRVTHGPLIAVTGAVEAVSGWVVAYERIDDDRVLVDTNADVALTYTAGSQEVPAAVRFFVAAAVARSLSAPVQVAIGVMDAYSVEGTSISYGAGLSSTTDSPAGYTVGELSALERQRRIVFA